MGSGYDLFNPPKTPSRPTHVQQPYQTFTPCTRLSRMTIASGTSDFQRPVKSFQERLMEANRKEAQSKHETYLDQDQIIDKKRRLSFFSDEEDESDEGDMFSSGLYPMSSSPANRVYPRFDDEAVLSTSTAFKKSIFDDDDDDIDMGFYDPSTDWLAHVYRDNSSKNTDSQSFVTMNEDEAEENKLPSSWSEQEQKRSRCIITKNRLPLQEIDIEEGLPAKKKILVGSGKQTKLHLIKTLSPPGSTIKQNGNIPTDL